MLKSSMKNLVVKFVPTLFLSIIAILAAIFSVITALNYDGDNREAETE